MREGRGWRVGDREETNKGRKERKRTKEKIKTMKERKKAWKHRQWELFCQLWLALIKYMSISLQEIFFKFSSGADYGLCIKKE